jgi:signal transduction histidine kinase
MGKNKFIDRLNRRFFFRGLSIQQRLPLLICILLLSIIIAFSWAAYVGVKKASLAIAADRLRTVTDQLSSILGQTSRVTMISAHNVAKEEPVRKYLQSGATIPDSAAKASLQKLQTDTQSLYVELLDQNRKQVLRAGRKGIQVKVNNDSMLSDLQVAPDSSKVGKIYLINDSLYYAVVATVTDNKQTIGYLIRWKQISATPEGMKQFSQLLGTNAMIYVGNADGTVWSDLMKPVEAPPVNVLDTGKYFSYSRPKGGPVIAMTKPIEHTQWTLLLEFSQQKILEGAKKFASWILIIGAIITIIGIIVAWIMSRNITKPLKKLTAAATDIASGNYNTSVDVNRNDELGKLALAFNSMAVKIRNAQQDLEKKVIERTTQLETVNKELEAFTYSISHDLRTPLRGIIGFTAMLEEDYGNKLDDEAKRITSIIKSNTIKMGHLIDGLLSFSRMERQDVTKTEISTTIMVNEVIDSLQQQNKGPNIEWLIQELPEIKGDVNMIRQVWVNLISNAIKYSGNQKNPHVEIGVFSDEGQTVFFIKDNGVGFDKKYKDKLFGVFQRLHSAEEFEGTGIGLALVEKIISKHGGRVWAEAEMNKGATFYFSLSAN